MPPAGTAYAWAATSVPIANPKLVLAVAAVVPFVPPLESGTGALS